MNPGVNILISPDCIRVICSLDLRFQEKMFKNIVSCSRGWRRTILFSRVNCTVGSRPCSSLQPSTTVLHRPNGPLAADLRPFSSASFSQVAGEFKAGCYGPADPELWTSGPIGTWSELMFRFFPQVLISNRN